MRIVYVHTKPDRVEGFKAACTENSRISLQEAGIARFGLKASGARCA